MVIRASGDNVVASVNKGLCHGARIRNHILTIGSEFRLQRLFIGHRLPGYGVHEGSSLRARKHQRGKLLFNIGVSPGHDHSATRTA